MSLTTGGKRQRTDDGAGAGSGADAGGDEGGGSSGSADSSGSAKALQILMRHTQNNKTKNTTSGKCFTTSCLKP